MLPEMRYIEEELLPMLRENADRQRKAVEKQLEHWNGAQNSCPILLVTDCEEAQRLPKYDLEEIHYDSEKMFVNGLREALGVALSKGDAVASIRSNMGCGIFPTMFGLKQMIFPDKMPWLQEHVSKEKLMHMTPDDLVETPEYKAGLEHMRFMKQMLKGTGIDVYPMDLQGAVDTAHLVYGDEFFYDLYDDPDFIHHLLELSNAGIIKGMQDCLDIIKPDDYVAHYNFLALPSDKPCKISEDTSTLLSKKHIMECSVVYTNRLLEHFGGGYIHFCGKNEHLLNASIQDVSLSLAVNFGNPEMQDMAAVFEQVKKQGIKYLGSVNRQNLELWLESSYQDGIFHIMPVVYCKREEQDMVLEHFKRTVERIIRNGN